MKNKTLVFLDFYKKIVDRAFITPFGNEIDTLLRDFSDCLGPITNYMLKDRFEANRPRTKTKTTKKQLPHSSDLAMLREMCGMGSAMAKEKQEVSNGNPLDIIKAYKLLEFQAISGLTPSEDQWFQLDLGRFLEPFVDASNSLSKLLISVRDRRITELEKSLVQIMSTICVYRCFKVKAKASDATITAPYAGDKPLDKVIAEYFTDQKIDRFLDKFVDAKKLTNFDELFIYSGNASSPNGGHSSINYLADIAALMKDEKLLSSIFGIIKHFKYGKELKQIVDILCVNIDREYLNGKEHSRLVTFTAPGGKSRIIAVVDWLSQTALSAIHRTQFQLLAMIPSDRTYDHKAGLDLYDPNAECYHSVDLSAATDRLPRALQSRLIERIFVRLGLDGTSIARHWDVIVDREYVTQNSLLEKVAPKLRYAVGQGMGLFSSWSSMALVHHYIVHELCDCPFGDYVLVGDDLLLKNCKLQYEKYLQIMSEIGVTVNPTKTIISESKPHCLEFARNFIILGRRVQPIPLGSVFAYIDGKIGNLEAFTAFTPVFRHISIINLIKYLKISDPVLLTDIAYFLVKESITTYNNAKALLTFFGVNLLLTSEHIASIAKIVMDRASAPMRLRITKLTQALQSQCTIIRENDMEKLSSLALDFSVLKFAGEEIEEYSQVMHDRINSAKFIEYDHDYATRTISKREHRLIKDLLITLEMENPNVRAGPGRTK